MTSKTSKELNCFNLKTAIIIVIWLIAFGLGLEVIDQAGRAADGSGGILNQLDLSRESADHFMIVVGGVLFVLLWALLEKNLFGPFLKLNQAREAATEGASSDAVDLQNRANNLTEQYESEVFQTRTESMQTKLQKIAATKNEVEKILGSAEKEANQLLSNERENIASQLSDLRRKIESEGDLMVNDVVQKLTSPAN